MIADRKLAERSMAEVEAEVRAVKRGQYLQISRRMDGLYAEAQTRGTLSRTKLWNYRAYREMEVQLREFCEVDVRTQKHGMDKLLGEVFENVIGQPMENFDPGRIILPYSPRAVIDTAWSGENYSARIWKNTNRLADEIRNEAQQVVMGLKSPGQVKRDLMNYYEVSYNQAARLIDTEVSYVLNKAGIENYRRLGVQKVTIITLDVNTCEKCRALQGQVFLIDDAPVIPIHPRCHCSYCVPADGDAAEVTASGANLDELYAREGVKGYGTEGEDGAVKLYTPKGVKPQAQTIPAGKLEAKAAEGMAAFERPEIELTRAPKSARAKAETMPQAPADSAAVPSSPAIAQPETEAAKTAENTGLSGVSGLREMADSGTMVASTEAAGDGVRYLCKLDKAIYSCVAGNITTDEVVLTDERIKHIQEHHPNDYERYEKYISEMVTSPDYIIETSAVDTAFIVNEFNDGDDHFRLILKLKTNRANNGYKNSIIQFQYIRAKEFRRIIRNKIILYKKAGL